MALKKDTSNIFDITDGKRIIELQSALKVVDEWLNSDDIFIVDKNGKTIEGARTVSKPFSIAKRFISQMVSDNHW